MAYLWLVSVGSALGVLFATRTLLAIRRDGRPQQLAEIEVLVVFGAAVDSVGPSLALRRRIEHVEALWRAQFASHIVCCGRSDERRAMTELLVGRGVPASAITVAPAVSTRASVRVLANLVAGADQIAAVSSPYHMHRILGEARRHGVNVIPAPSRLAFAGLQRRSLWPTMPNLARLYLREVVACAWYAWSAFWTDRGHDKAPHARGR